jgi:uncharacterized membrane protein YfcA
MPDNLWFYPIAFIAVLLTGIGKSGFGMAGGLPVPLLALVMPPAQAAAVMLPILMAGDAASVYAYRRDWDRANMRILLPAGLLGTAIGWAIFRYLNEHALRVFLGLISLGFVAMNLIRRSPAAAKPSRFKGYLWGTVSGVTSFVAQAGGAPLWIYLLPQRLEKRLHAGTTVMFFAVLNVVKVFPYWMLGLLSAPNMLTAAALLPVTLAGIVLGLWVQRRLSTSWFFRIVYSMLFFTGAMLIYDGLRKL